MPSARSPWRPARAIARAPSLRRKTAARGEVTVDGVVMYVPEGSDGSMADLLDAENIARAQRGERCALDRLLRKYRSLVRARAKTCAGRGLDIDDLTQIGMIGLWHAIMQFRRDQSLSFPAYASVCIRRQMITAMRARFRQKRGGDAHLVGIEQMSEVQVPIAGGVGTAWPHWKDPAEEIAESESYAELCAGLRRVLSQVEWFVLIEHHRGKSYLEIAEELRCSVKSVDNALARARRKVHAIAPVPAELHRRLVECTDRVSATGSRRRITSRRRAHGFRPAQAAV